MPRCGTSFGLSVAENLLICAGIQHSKATALSNEILSGLGRVNRIIRLSFETRIIVGGAFAYSLPNIDVVRDNCRIDYQSFEALAIIASLIAGTISNRSVPRRSAIVFLIIAVYFFP